MFEDLTKIIIGDKEYPIKCDNYVLAKLQEKFETVGNFERLLIGIEQYEEDGTTKSKRIEPSYKAVNAAVVLMVDEGIEIHNEESIEQIEQITEKQILRNLSYPITDIALILHNEFIKCFATKKSLKVQNQGKKAKAK